MNDYEYFRYLEMVNFNYYYAQISFYIKQEHKEERSRKLSQVEKKSLSLELLE